MSLAASHVQVFIPESKKVPFELQRHHQDNHTPFHPQRTTNSISHNMAPKQQRIVVQKPDPRRPAQKGYFSSAYNTLTSAENASVVRSVAIFGVRYL